VARIRTRDAVNAVILWLWDAGSMHGVTDDESHARKSARACMGGSAADTARVERATLVTGVRTLAIVYRRTGTGWLARRDSSGRIRWTPLQAAPEPAHRGETARQSA
jgi:hypothetical protein